MRRTVIVSILLGMLLSGCTQTESDTSRSDAAISVVQETTAPLPEAAEKHSRVVFAMDTVMELTVYAGDDAILDEATQRITDLENKLSVTLESSEIHTLNSTGTAVLSEDTAALIADALYLCESTEGALDITVYPVVRAWGFTTGDYRIPSYDELDALLETVDHTAVTLNGLSASVPDGVQVDLGSVAKGYTGDVLCELLRENGITSALLNLGGNVQAVGGKPDGTPWKIAVQHPTDSSSYLGALTLTDKAAITSGGYERYFVGDDGQTYWHIIDPVAGRPADNGILSVTIVGESGLLCDAMSTALFVMGLDGAAEYWRIHEGFDAIIVMDDGSVHITEGLTDSFTLMDAYKDVKLTVIER